MSDDQVNQKPLAVVYVIGSLEVGGTERQLVMLANNIIDQGAAVSVFAFDGTGSLRRAIEQRGAHIYDGGYRSPGEWVPRLFQVARAQIRLGLLLMRVRPDVIHSFLPLANFSGALMARIVGIGRIITSRRGLGTHQERRRVWRWLDRVAYMLSHTVTVNSRAVLADASRREGSGVEKFALIYNGIEFDHFKLAPQSRLALRSSLGLADGALALVNVGNLIPYKGHADLLQAFVRVYERYPQAVLFIAGEDRFGTLQVLENQAVAAGIGGAVRFLGRREDIAELLCAMDVAAFSSHEEGFSNALLEALAVGLPVVATDVGGNREALDHGRAGRLVAPRCPEALANGILDTLGDLERAKRKAIHGQLRVRSEFSVSAMVSNYRDLYGMP